MKIVSVVVFAAALISTWVMARPTGGVPESMHVNIQNDLKRIITEYVENALPDAENLRFERFWTETLKNNKIRAVFSYSFEDDSQDDPVVMQINGSAILNKVEETPETVTWSMDELRIDDSVVDFQNDVHIIPEKKTDAE